MAIISITEAADFIWGSVTSANFKLQVIVNGVNGFIDDYIGYDITSWNKTEVIKFCDISKEEWAFWVKTANAKTLNKINWQTYTWTKWFSNPSDYRIVQGRKFLVDDLYRYTQTLNDIYFEIEYSAWYDVWEYEDLKYIALLMVEKQYNKDWWKDVERYTLWPRTVVFGNLSEDDKMTATRILNKYRIINIKG